MKTIVASIFAALMQAPIIHKLKDQTLWLSPQRTIFWEEQKTLIVSDLHFGKTGHFRKSGIAVPQDIYKEDLQRLVSQLQHFNPSELLVVGDFFHSHYNSEMDWFIKWRQDFSSLNISLVKGNHDVLKKSWYQAAEINLIENETELDPFFFIHEN
ncbi:MAG TPA: hypothetical protein VM368_09675, partial [Flavisolibacter sp.]|nr:hypothetical protein [Flavisolibacter sp.]